MRLSRMRFFCLKNNPAMNGDGVMIYLPELGDILKEASDKKSYLPEVHHFLKDEADTVIYLPDHGSIFEEASDKKSYVPEVHHFQRDEADTTIYLPEVRSILEGASNIKIHTLDAAPLSLFCSKQDEKTQKRRSMILK